MSRGRTSNLHIPATAASALETCCLPLCCSMMPATVYMRAIELMEADVGPDLVALHVQSGACFGFNAVAATIWRKLSVPKSLDRLQAELLKDYDVSPDQCLGDLRTVLEDMIDQGLVRES